MTEEKTTGLILNIQRMSTEDGPGIRTTVFFKGCSLACAWCHNPESIPFGRQLQWIETRCIGCGTCTGRCETGALTAVDSVIAIDRGSCTACGSCVEACPSLALEMLGADWQAGALAEELAKDRAYFESSGGGVTLSGGEPAMQPDFAAALLADCRRRGLHTALDTCGLCAPNSLDALLPHADLILFDLKEIDPERHRAFTGSDNERILTNLLRVRDHIARSGGAASLWVRTPVIPGATARDENIVGIGAFITARLEGTVARWELCSFNNLCRDKYRRLDLDWQYRNETLLDRAAMEHLHGVAQRSGVDPAIVHWSGATRHETTGGARRPELRLVKG